MMFSQIIKFGRVSLLIAVIVQPGMRACLAGCEAAMGELKLEGEHIERLVLLRMGGPAEMFDEPNETIRLPVGRYLVNDLRLKGGYRSQTTPDGRPIDITESTPTLFRQGGPLKHTVSVLRRGRILELSYQLQGIGGETYESAASGGEPPTFAVYSGDKQIAAGQFEFG